MEERIERLMNRDTVRRFFPRNLAELVSFPQEEIKCVGIESERTKEHKGELVISKELYLAAVVSNLFLFKRNERLDFRVSRNKWIRGEAEFYDAIAERTYREQLYGYSPLLVLRIQNWTQPQTSPFQFAELLRYADHDQFRRRGIASAVFDTVCTELTERYQTQFVYANFGWTSAPKSLKAIPICFCSEETIEEIRRCFPRDYYSDSSFERTRFLRFMDATRHAIEYGKAMERYEAHARNIRRDLPPTSVPTPP